MLRFCTIAKIGSSEEQKNAQEALLKNSGANSDTRMPEQHQRTPHKKVQLHSTRMEQQTNTHTQAPAEYPTTTNSTSIMSKAHKEILQPNNLTHKRRRLK